MFSLIARATYPWYLGPGQMNWTSHWTSSKLKFSEKSSSFGYLVPSLNFFQCMSDRSKKFLVSKICSVHFATKLNKQWPFIQFTRVLGSNFDEYDIYNRFRSFQGSSRKHRARWLDILPSDRANQSPFYSNPPGILGRKVDLSSHGVLQWKFSR